MPSKTREELNTLLQKWSNNLNIRNGMYHFINKLDILDVGIAGDNEKPSDRYVYFGRGNNFKTLDIDADLHPDYVADIKETPFVEQTWNLIIVCQCLEHIWNPQKVFDECYRILKKGGYLIIDSPFMYEYHDPPDYHRFTIDALEKYANITGFEIIDKYSSNNLNAILCQRKQ